MLKHSTIQQTSLHLQMSIITRMTSVVGVDFDTLSCKNAMSQCCRPGQCLRRNMSTSKIISTMRVEMNFKDHSFSDPAAITVATTTDVIIVLCAAATAAISCKVFFILIYTHHG